MNNWNEDLRILHTIEDFSGSFQGRTKKNINRNRRKGQNKIKQNNKNEMSKNVELAHLVMQSERHMLGRQTGLENI